MISWLAITILAYFFFSLSFLGDKLILAGPPKPNSYTFFVGISNIAVVLLVPFIKLDLPNTAVLFWIILEAVVFIFGLYVMYSALERFEASRVAPTMGAIQPIFIFLLSWFIFGAQAMNETNILAFALLLIGTVMISAEKKYRATGGYLNLTLLAALLFSIDYILSKIIFLSEPFLFGLFWMRIFAFLLVLPMLFFRKNRQDIFAKKNILNKKTGALFAFTNMSGGVANLLQAFAISLAPVAFLPVVNALRGVQYIFIFLLTLFFSIFLPRILKEEISKTALIRKAFSITLIVIGLAILIA